jgi:two-component system nitrogen regulation sensor histidine kinase GlnL
MKEKGTRILVYALLIVFNAFFWTLLVAFHWELSLRAREVEYFERQLFPVGIHTVPLPVIYGICFFLSAASIGAIVRDRSNLSARKKLQTLLEQILASLEIGVIVLDQKEMLVLANESARKLLPLSRPIQSDCRFMDVLESYPELREIVKSTLREGKFAKEVEQKLGPAESACTVKISTLPLKDRQQKVNGTLLLVSDVSEEVEMQKQMRDAERLSTMGTLAAALAHEIRNPLEALNLNLELLDRSLKQYNPPAPEEEKIEKYIKVFDSEVSRLAGIVENFLSFSRPSRSRSSNINLPKILRQVLELIENQAESRGISMSLCVQEEPIILAGFEDQLRQLFLNLIINGLEAMPKSGRLSVRVGTTRRADSELSTPRVVVSIQDTGEGIPAEEMNRIFEPFFSTRSRGTGLGLTIANRIAGEHGGIIRVESTQGKGSNFIVELPLSA